MTTRKYTDEQFIEAVRSSTSVSEVLTKLGLKPAGGNYEQFWSNTKRLQIDTSHFTGQAHLKNKNHDWATKRSLSEILIENIYTNSYRLKRRLIFERIFSHKCSLCENFEWLGKAIPLELEHINGIKTDNRLINLCLLCPNCHAQTPTYRGKNRKTYLSKIKYNCLTCNKLLSQKRKSGKCISCIRKK